MLNYINDLWNEFYDECVSPDLPPEKVVTLRNMFFVGASAMFAVIDTKLNDATISDQDGQEFINSLRREIDDFIESMPPPREKEALT